jgi:hypothetical protein
MQFCDIIAVYIENHTEVLNSMWTAFKVFPFKADGPVIDFFKVLTRMVGQSVK